VLAASGNFVSFSRNFTRSAQSKSCSSFKMLSTENAVAKSLAPEMTPGSALNLVSIHFMNLEIPVSMGMKQDERQTRLRPSHNLSTGARAYS
jgi:hypothetical protein